MIRIVRGPTPWSGDGEAPVLYIDHNTSTYNLSYKDGNGTTLYWGLCKEVAVALANSLDPESYKAQDLLLSPGKVFKITPPPVTDVTQMVDKGYTAQDLINLKREGII